MQARPAPRRWSPAPRRSGRGELPPASCADHLPGTRGGWRSSPLKRAAAQRARRLPLDASAVQVWWGCQPIEQGRTALVATVGATSAVSGRRCRAAPYAQPGAAARGRIPPSYGGLLGKPSATLPPWPGSVPLLPSAHHGSLLSSHLTYEMEIKWAAFCLQRGCRHLEDPAFISSWNTSCGTSTLPSRRMRRFPSFCFSSSLRLLQGKDGGAHGAGGGWGCI